MHNPEVKESEEEQTKPLGPQLSQRRFRQQNKGTVHGCKGQTFLLRGTVGQLFGGDIQQPSDSSRFQEGESLRCETLS